MDRRLRNSQRYGTREEALRERLRAGLIDPKRLVLAAQCGDEDAGKVVGVKKIREFWTLAEILWDVDKEQVINKVDYALRAGKKFDTRHGIAVNCGILAQGYSYQHFTSWGNFLHYKVQESKAYRSSTTWSELLEAIMVIGRLDDSM